MEVDCPSAFMPWDDASEIDWSRVPPMATVSMGAAIALGELLKKRSRFQAEWEFIVVIDLSRSMLSDRVSQNNGDGIENAKLNRLFQSVCAFIQVAEAAGFILKTLYLADGKVADKERELQPKAYALRAMILMRELLLKVFSSALEKPWEREPFCLAKGIKEAMEVRSQSFIVVISDFLEPLNPSLKGIVAESMKRHSVHLVDVAAPWERNFPVPGMLDWEAKRIELGFGPRHLELGCQAKAISRSQVLAWNKERSRDIAHLRGLARKFNARWHAFGQLEYLDIMRRALSAFVK